MNKKAIIGVIIGAAVLLIIGLVVMNVTGKSDKNMHPSYGADQTLPKLSADEIGFTVKKVDTHNVKIYLTKTSDIKSFTYDVIYDAYARDENNQPLTDKVDRDAASTEDIKLSSGQSYESPAILLGSCSTGGKCVYDTGTTKVTTDLKVTKSDGKQYQSEYILNLSNAATQ